MLRLIVVFALTLGWTVTAIATDPVDEVRKSFTIGGKPIPPEIFGDFGDAMMSDSRPIIVAVDALAAIGSNRYYDPIETKGDWVEQGKPQNKGLNGIERMAYKFIGATDNGLLVVIAAWTGGGTGIFYWLHVVDAAWVPAFDEDGSTYHRLDLTLVRSYILGDRWQGEVKISGNTIRVVTSLSLGGHGVSPVTLQASRP